MAGRGRIRWHRWLIVALLTLAVYLAAAGWYLGRIGVGLLILGPSEAVVVAAPRPDDPVAMGYRGDPSVALGLPFEDVVIGTDLGPAAAWFVPADGDGAVAALYVHGIAGVREGGYRYLPLLREAGIPTLLVTYRGDADAPRPPDGAHAFGLTEWRDVAAAADWLAGRGHDRILLIGDSMGGAIIGQFLLQAPQAAAVVAVALDSPAVDLHAVLAHLGRNLRLPLADAVALIARQVAGWQLGLPLAAAQVSAVLAAFDGPLFIAHGTGDGVVPIAGSDALVAARDGVTVSLRGDANHLGSHAADPARYAAAFAGFLAVVLR